MKMRKYGLAIITALSLCDGELQSMQIYRSCWPVLMGVGVFGAVCLGGHLYHTRSNAYSITYSKREGEDNEIIFNNIGLTRGRGKDCDTILFNYGRRPAWVRKLIGNQLVDHMIPLLQAGKLVTLELSDTKTAKFRDANITKEKIVDDILEIMRVVELEPIQFGSPATEKLIEGLLK